MKSSLRITLDELFEEAVRLSQSPDVPYVAFVEYSGHVNWVSLRIFHKDTKWDDPKSYEENRILDEKCYAIEDDIPFLRQLVRKLVSLQVPDGEFHTGVE